MGQATIPGEDASFKIFYTQILNEYAKEKEKMIRRLANIS